MKTIPIRSRSRLAGFVRRALCVALCGSAFVAGSASAQDSRLTYQGHLEDAGADAQGAYDLLFLLQDTAGATIGVPVSLDNVAVVRGVFTVSLDFGDAAFDGSARFLQVQVRDG